MDAINTRRDFLKLSAASFAALAGGFYAPNVLGQTYDRSAFAGAAAGKGREYIAWAEGVAYEATGQGAILALDVASGDTVSVPVTFFGHIVNQNPVRPRQLVSFERWGRQGALVDLLDRKVIARAEASDSNMFFGHAVFNAEGSILITTEDDFHVPQGKLVLRDAATLKIIQKMDSYGLRPHECRSPDQGKTVMVVNGGYQNAAPNLTWIDVQSGKLVSQIELGAPNHVMYTHCDISPDHWICVAGTYNITGLPNKEFEELVVFISPDGRVLKPALPKDIMRKIQQTTIQEALSIAFLGQSDLAAITIPYSNMVLVFDYKKQNLVEVVTLQHPQGVLPTAPRNDADANMLVSLADGKMVSVARHKGKPAATRVVETGKSNYNAHLSRIYV